MEEIKVGEYIKTVAGYIGKIIDFDDGMYTAKMKDATIDLYVDDIKNHKENIKDLVQAGDVIKYKYSKISRIESIGIVVKNTDYRTLKEYLSVNNYKLEQIDILEILTKEQFEKNCYKVVE